MTFGRRHLAAAACVPLLVALGACTDGEPEPDFSPSESSTPTETATPTPAAWEENSEDGAVAFAEHWVDVFSNAMQSQDTDALREISAPGCSICTDFADRLDQIKDSGGFYRGEGWRVLQTAPIEGLPSNQASIALRINEGAEVVRESSDGEIVRNPAARATWTAHMRWVDGRWVLTDFELVE